MTTAPRATGAESDTAHGAGLGTHVSPQREHARSRDAGASSDFFAGEMVVLPEQLDAPKAQLVRAPVVDNVHLGDRYWRLRLTAPSIAVGVQPGQFVMLTVTPTGPSTWVLPRPMAVFDRNEATGTIDVVYGVLGWGTRQMSGITPGDELTVVGPLGRGFDLPAKATNLLVVGRGIGLCSLGLLAEAAVRQGSEVTVVTSSRHPGADILQPAFALAGCQSVISVVDSDGTSAPEALEARLEELMAHRAPQQIATCGSRRLLALCTRLAQRWRASLQVAVEAHMACGMGYCHGCSAWVAGPLDEGPLVCRDGPVFGWNVGPEGHFSSWGPGDQGSWG